VLAGIEEGYSTIPSQKLLIESFRLGIVPERLVTEWTVGREDEVTYIRNWLELESEGTMVLEGAYGSGKSHLLLYLREKALEMGYAVAYAGFDPSEASAAFPKRTYRKIVRGFKVRFDGETYGFRGFIEQIALRAGDESLGDHFYLGPIIRNGSKEGAVSGVTSAHSTISQRPPIFTAISSVVWVMPLRQSSG
jgi:hypothetical protein